MGAAVIRGLCSPSPGDLMQRIPKFVISPRNAKKAAELAADFPEHITIAKSNQEVVDLVECVMVAVLKGQVEEVISGLKFRAGQQVLSLVAGFSLSRLQELAVPATECATAIPLPAVARRKGATLVYPPKAFAKAIFEPLGTCVCVENDAHFKRMLCVSCIMGDFYKRQLTISSWLASGGVPEADAAAWTGATFATFAADSCQAGPSTFKHLVEEQTPGGLNEFAWRAQEEDGSYNSLLLSLNAVHHRVVTGAADPALAPAVKRSSSRSVKSPSLLEWMGSLCGNA
ncbi:unnamed protein product [Polarella glacialis]|nr:unnamed protein product [Polarella glacialis]|eukprot:CAMPEP_0115124948 /NCGR_PEP_ID=MMETSP0227-20121206/48688_1 /TAXON_ID=89957 /ORGANISM="Polarella glacialis, Strain CCMP 1383" /LENGTH=285 /DNA_ID=CAMNT_0002528101 /DNA_START=136 /DNA_END=993 /DNA_ORIENTATION=-